MAEVQVQYKHWFINSNNKAVKLIEGKLSLTKTITFKIDLARAYHQILVYEDDIA